MSLTLTMRRLLQLSQKHHTKMHLILRKLQPCPLKKVPPYLYSPHLHFSCSLFSWLFFIALFISWRSSHELQPRRTQKQHIQASPSARCFHPLNTHFFTTGPWSSGKRDICFFCLFVMFCFLEKVATNIHQHFLAPAHFSTLFLLLVSAMLPV